VDGTTRRSARRPPGDLRSATPIAHCGSRYAKLPGDCAVIHPNCDEALDNVEFVGRPHDLPLSPV
jgi:hypothetical protein